jgi:small ligand-binding sensory domain FIST
MSLASFVHAHAAHADWRVAVEQSYAQIQTQIAARTSQQGRSAPFTLGWCYLTDYYAPAAETILAELHQRLPGVAWVGTVGVGVAASGVEYIDEPAMVLMVAPMPRESFQLFSGRQPLPAVSSRFVPHTALVHAEGSTPDLQELLQELSTRTATGYLFGGLSSARNRTVHMADGVFTGGLSGVAFGPEVGLISRVTQGCQPIGPVRQITQAEGNLVVSLDGKPALDCVLQDLGLDQDLPDHELSQALTTTLVGLSTGAEDVPSRPGQFGVDTVVRHICAGISAARAATRFSAVVDRSAYPQG